MRSGFTVLVFVALGALFGWLAVHAFGELRALPATPDVFAGPGDVRESKWARVTDGVVRCDLQEWNDRRSSVPFTDAAGTVALRLELDNKTLCATLTPPLSGRIHRLANVSLLEPGAAPYMMTLNPDVPGGLLRDGLLFSGLLAAVLSFGGWRLRQLMQARAQTRSAVQGEASSAAVPGAAGALDAIAHNIAVGANDTYLPQGPLTLCEAAETRARRARTVGAPLIAAFGVAAAGFAGWIAWDIAESRYIWNHGVEVPAEVKGETTRYQGIYVRADLVIAYADPRSDPNNPQLLSATETFGTWFVGPGDSAGAVRVLPNAPEHLVTQARAERWPWRLPTPVVALLAAFGAAFGAWQTRRGAGRFAAIAAAPEEVLAQVVSVTENRVNGATTGYTVKVMLPDTGPLTLALSAKHTPDQLVATSDGRILLVRAKDQPRLVEPVLTNHWPFELNAAQRAHFEAVRAARAA